MNQIMNGWFSEIWPGRALSIEIERLLFSKRSAYQQIELLQTTQFGKMLALDGLIQFTEEDEFAYQEMLAHLPLFAHPNPEKVLVIGGGDGGILREIARHSMVKEIDLCEIDEEVVKVCKEFVPSMACGFDDPRVTLHIADGYEFIQSKHNSYDVIIVDSSDPVGPGEVLWQAPFCTALKEALMPDGILAVQAGFMFLEKAAVANLLTIVNELFPVWAYAYALVPTYPSGNIGFYLASLGSEVKKPVRLPSPELQKELQYYTPRIHEASFVLPAFAERMMSDILSKS